MQTQRHLLHHWWFRALVICALVLLAMLAIRMHSASGETPRAHSALQPSLLTMAVAAPSGLQR